ncbi:GGDEF domain-containing protein [Oceanimonas doudoroffii]|uniref:GGDEF domain-containing protein n=2 Tax=Oceanimonas doudoroffii TaxID=84158 RepID=A0A233RK19_9GAMM|nr:GGDEF domain-containing protein [Oceanimonas doudoroffii]
MSLPALPQAQHTLCFFRLDPQFHLYPLTALPAGLTMPNAEQSLLERLNEHDRQRLEQACHARQATQLGLTVNGRRWQCHLAPVEHDNWLLSADVSQNEHLDELGLLEWRLHRALGTERDARLAELADLLFSRLRPDRIIIWRHYEADELLRPIYSQGLPFALRPVRADRRYLRTLHQRGGLSYSHCAGQPLLAAFDYLSADSIHHRLDVPLPFTPGTAGLLSLEYARPHPAMSASDMQFVAALATHLARAPELTATLPAGPVPDGELMTRLTPLLCRHTGQDFFNQLMLQLVGLTGAHTALVGLKPRQADTIRVLACSRQGQLCPPFSYHLAHTPCAMTLETGEPVRLFTTDVATQFPDDKRLTEAHIQGYAGLALRHEDGSPLGTLALLFDRPLTQPASLQALLQGLEPRVGAELRQRRMQEGLMVTATAFEAREGIFIADSQMRIQQANQAFARLCGLTTAELTDMSLLALRADMPGVYEVDNIIQALERTGWWQGEQQLLRTDGQPLPVNVRVSKIRDGLGITHYVYHVEDISEQQANRHRIEKMAYGDELTGLHNRRFMVEHIRDIVTLAGQGASRGALLLLDLDDFKNINNSLGYAVGDALLVQVAERLTRFCVGLDGVSLARIASDEFVLLCPNLGHGYTTAKTRAEQIAKGLRELFALPFEISGLRLHVSASAGISLFPLSDAGHEEYLRQADTASHMAKRIAPGSHVFFNREMAEEIQERLQLSNALQQALRNEELELHFQPQLSLEQDRVLGAEALLRWQPPGQAPIPPGLFIPVAEETSLICEIGDWVLQRACARLQHWREHNSGPVRLSVNISARHFHSPDFVSRMETLLQRFPGCRHRLILEVTEGVILENLDESRQRMARLKELGCLLSIDDFGTGYSSFAYLRELPVDELKLDRAFIRHIDTHPRDRAIIACILQLARQLQLAVVAEGVETEPQRSQLRLLGCPAYQGFLRARPMPEDALMNWLSGQA